MILLNNDKLKIHDKPFIVIDDEDNSSTENQETLLDEEPVITIETDDEPEKENVATQPRRRCSPISDASETTTIRLTRGNGRRTASSRSVG